MLVVAYSHEKNTVQPVTESLKNGVMMIEEINGIFVLHVRGLLCGRDPMSPNDQ